MARSHPEWHPTEGDITFRTEIDDWRNILSCLHRIFGSVREGSPYKLTHSLNRNLNYHIREVHDRSNNIFNDPMKMLVFFNFAKIGS